MNVRFFAHKMNQALQLYLLELGVVPDARPETVLQRLRTQHIRFLREARIATPLSIDCAVCGQRPGELDVLNRMLDYATGESLATFRMTLDSADWRSPRDSTVPVPDEAAPRGLDPDALYGCPATEDDARALGFVPVGHGVIGAEECDASGQLLPHVYIGRISDDVPNLGVTLSDPEELRQLRCGETGSVAIEYCLRIHAPLRAGDRFAHMGGLRALGGKTRHVVHALINPGSGRLAASAEVIGVHMDLSTRRAVPISEDARRLATRKLLRGA
jgi:acyl-CoA thioester hydrolase